MDGEPPSHLTLILDLSPAQWHLSSLESNEFPLTLQSFLTQVVTFINSHLAGRHENAIAVFGAFPGKSAILYTSDSPAPAAPSPSPENANTYQPLKTVDSIVISKIMEELSNLEGVPDSSTGLVGALTKGLCHINRILHPSAGIHDPQAHALDPRMLILSVSPDMSSSYIPIMNSIFAAQKLKVKIDICKVFGDDAVFLQQAAHLTGGSYVSLRRRDALLQYLVMCFLAASTIRSIINLPTQDRVDLRAACFCHKDIVDIGYVCSYFVRQFQCVLPAEPSSRLRHFEDLDLGRRNRARMAIRMVALLKGRENESLVLCGTLWSESSFREKKTAEVAEIRLAFVNFEPPKGVVANPHMDAVSRKRPPSPADPGPSHIKKRALTAANGLPAHHNGDSAIETEREPSAENLEQFRKEALFRRMRQNQRERDRAEARIVELERRRRVLEAAIGAVENCWNQILDQLQTLVKTDSLRLPGPSNVTDLLHLVELQSEGSDAPSKEFHDALLADGMKTQALVAAFTAMTPKPTHEYDDLLTRCQNTAAEATSLRSELHLTHAKLVDSRTELAQYKGLLSDAEMREQRARSETVLAMEMMSSRVPQTKVKEEESTPVVLSASASPAAPPKTNGHVEEKQILDDDLWRQQAQKREKEIDRLSSEKAKLESQLSILEAQISSSSEEIIRQHPIYVTLTDKIGVLKREVETIGEERDCLQAELEDVKSRAAKELEKHEMTLNSQRDSFTEQLTKKGKEANRIRDQRDGFNKELTILKGSDTARVKQSEVLNVRVQTLEDRVASFVLEVKRLKAELATKANSEESVSLISNLKDQLKAAEEKVTAIKSTFSSLDQSNPDVAIHLRAEAEARQECVSLRARIAEFERVFGTQMSSDSNQLAILLREKEGIIRSLQSEQNSQKEAANELFEELQRMSSAWDALNNDSKSHATQVEEWKRQLERAQYEKAKADNKYYAAMREKDATENERKALHRDLLKQQTLAAKLQDSQTSYQTEVEQLKAQVEGLNIKLKVYEERIQVLTDEAINLRHTQTSQSKQFESIKGAFENAQADVERKRQQTRRLEDELAQVKKSAEKEIAKAKLANSAGGSSSQREDALQDEVNKLMTILRCSTCNQQFRSHILLKCMHTFCKDCIDARLTTRQRKCPACNLKFQDSDVQAFFFQ